MKEDLDILTIIVAIWVAGYVAMMLDYAALTELGWSLAQLRGSAMLGVLLTSALTLADLLKGRRGRFLGRG